MSPLKAMKGFCRRCHLTVVESPVSNLKKAQLTSIHTVAPEILAEIFGWCVDKSLSISNDSAPLLLLQVCKQWRHIAMDTPNLWTEIVLAWPGEVVVSPRVVVSMWLHNSGVLPINIYINAVSWRHPKTRLRMERRLVTNTLEYILHSISSHLGRCRTFHYAGQGVNYLLDKIYPSDGHIHMPLLQDFQLASSTRTLFGYPTNPERTIAAPDLRILDVPDVFFAELCEVSLLDLKSLSIGWQRMGTEDVIIALENIHAHSLESFALTRRYESFNSIGLASSLERFLPSSTLKKLTIIRTSLSHKELMKILTATPTLESLHLSADEINVNRLCLDHGDPTTWILPRLSSLSLELMIVTGLQATNIVRSRAVDYYWALEKLEGFQRLTHIALINCYKMDWVDMSKLRDLTQNIDGFLFEQVDDSSDADYSHGYLEDIGQ